MQRIGEGEEEAESEKYKEESEREMIKVNKTMLTHFAFATLCAPIV
jgi:hypothetical protein